MFVITRENGNASNVFLLQMVPGRLLLLSGFGILLYESRKSCRVPGQRLFLGPDREERPGNYKNMPAYYHDNERHGQDLSENCRKILMAAPLSSTG